MHDAEAKTIQAFVIPGRRPRVAALLDKPDRARRLDSVLPHQRVLDERFMSQVPPSEADAEHIAATLRGKGAPDTCRVIGGELDAQEFALEDALRRVVGWGEGCIVICIPGRRAYFEGEEKNDRYILER